MITLTVGYWLLVLVGKKKKIVIHGGELCSFSTKVVFILMEQCRLCWAKVFQSAEILQYQYYTHPCYREDPLSSVC